MSRILESKPREIIRYYAMDFEATEIFNLPKISHNTINTILGKIRKTIFIVSQKADKDYGEFELAESYFGIKRIKGKRSRGAVDKTPVFRLLKTDGKVLC